METADFPAVVYCVDELISISMFVSLFTFIPQGSDSFPPAVLETGKIIIQFA